jgi:hypothetical protein
VAKPLRMPVCAFSHTHELTACFSPRISHGADLAAVFGTQDTFGKMSFSIYKQAYFDRLSPLDFGMRPNASTHNPGRTYRFYQGPLMLHPFGSGLQYNSWELRQLQVSETLLSTADLESAGSGPSSVLRVTCQARHTGTFGHAEVPVLLFASSPGAGQDGRPIRTLVGFRRIAANQGESAELSLNVAARSFMLASPDGAWSAQRGQWKLELEAFTVHELPPLTVR